MLEAKKSRWFEYVFSIYNRNLMQRRFHSFHISGLHHLENRETNVPLLLYANHSSWWDGLIIFEIVRRFSIGFFVMMEEKQLRKLSLFRRLGAFSVVRENPREAVKSINYAAKVLLENDNQTILIFPQGEILPNDLRPLHFYNGFARIIEKVGDCSAFPVALCYEFQGNFKPEIYVKIAAPDFFKGGVNFDSRAATKVLENRLTGTLDDLKQDFTSNKMIGYEKLF